MQMKSKSQKLAHVALKKCLFTVDKQRPPRLMFANKSIIILKVLHVISKQQNNESCSILLSDSNTTRVDALNTFIKQHFTSLHSY